MRVLLQFSFLIIACLLSLLFVVNEDVYEHIAKAPLPVFEPRSDEVLVRTYAADCLSAGRDWKACAATHADKLWLWQHLDEQEHYAQFGLSERKNNVRTAGIISFLFFAALLLARSLVSGFGVLNEEGAFDKPKGALRRAGIRREESEFYRLKRLYEDGLIPEEEFEAKKASLKARMERNRNLTKGPG